MCLLLLSENTIESGRSYMNTMSSEQTPPTASSPVDSVIDSDLEKQNFLGLSKAAIDASLAQYRDSERRLAKATREAPTFSRPLTERETDDSTQLWQIYNIIQKIDNIQQAIKGSTSNYPQDFGKHLASLNVLILNFLGLLSTLNDQGDEDQVRGDPNRDEQHVEPADQTDSVFAASASHVAQIDVYCGEMRHIIFVTVESLFKVEGDDREEDWKKEPAWRLEQIYTSTKSLQAPRVALKSHRTFEWVGEYITAAVEAGGKDWRAITGDSKELFRI